MLKKRLIYSLLYENGEFTLSRNFQPQTVGDLDWFRENYNFDAIAFSIDELIVINISRENLDIVKFSKVVLELSKICFIPIAAGGGIRQLDDVYSLLNSGADKIIVNTALIEDPKLVIQLVKIFGSQCVIASIDCRENDDDFSTYIHNGSLDTGLNVVDFVRMAEDLGVGEIYLTSIDRDGTGFGYDLDLLEKVSKATRIPVIASGGVGKFGHFVEGFHCKHITGASTANIYNFIVDGLKKAREYVINQGISLATWDYDLDSIKRN